MRCSTSSICSWSQEEKSKSHWTYCRLKTGWSKQSEYFASANLWKVALIVTTSGWRNSVTFSLSSRKTLRPWLCFSLQSFLMDFQCSFCKFSQKSSKHLARRLERKQTLETRAVNTPEQGRTVSLELHRALGKDARACKWDPWNQSWRSIPGWVSAQQMLGTSRRWPSIGSKLERIWWAKGTKR